VKAEYLLNWVKVEEVKKSVAKIIRIRTSIPGYATTEKILAIMMLDIKKMLGEECEKRKARNWIRVIKRLKGYHSRLHKGEVVEDQGQGRQDTEQGPGNAADEHDQISKSMEMVECQSESREYQQVDRKDKRKISEQQV
jgi:hypothetical protein